MTMRCQLGPKGRHFFSGIYVGEEVPARIFCQWCGECRDTEPFVPLEDSAQWLASGEKRTLNLRPRLR